MAKRSSTSRIPKTKKKKVAVKIEREEIPKGYGETKIVMLPRDPHWAFVYWELTDKTHNELSRKYGKDTYKKLQLVLRVYDVTDIEFNGKNAHKYFDINVSTHVDNWYVNMTEPNRSWCIALGLILLDGGFVSIARSNIAHMPRYGVSPTTDERWGILQKEFEQLLKLSGIEHIGKGSFDVAKLMRERWEEIVSISSRRASPLGISSFRPMPPERSVTKDFWLKANTELIVYGTTESDAKLTIDGQQVKLGPDGGFSLRFSLSDGTREIPIEAVSSDNTMSKSMTFTIRRETK